MTVYRDSVRIKGGRGTAPFSVVTDCVDAVGRDQMILFGAAAVSRGTAAGVQSTFFLTGSLPGKGDAYGKY